LKNVTNLKWVSNVIKVTSTDMDRSATYDFLLTLHSNHEPTGISYHFRDKWKFLSKVANFPTFEYLNATTDGVPLGIGYRRKGWKN